MTLITYNPIRPSFNIDNDFFNNFWSLNDPTNYKEKIQPSFDVTQNNESYFIAADLPGINKKDIEVSLVDETIKITGERKININHDDEFARYNNTQYGSFEKIFHMPDDAMTDNINAKMNNGVLLIELKKAKKIASKMKKIAIK